MNWYWFSVGAVGGMFFLGLRQRGRQQGLIPAAAPGQRVFTKEDRVARALEFGDVDVMTSTLEEVSDPLLRNALLERITAATYRQRSEPEKREAFYRYANRHLEDIPDVLASLAQSEEGRPESIATFKMLAIAMAEDERYDEAIQVCRTALAYGLEDGTKTGFEGRIARLEKKRGAGA